MRTIGVFSLILSGLLHAQTDLPRQGIHDPGVITTRQNITPAGTVTTFRGRVHGIAYPDSPGQLQVLTANT
ncbi:MAG: hypothetical protein NTY38_29460, partial [Acidobacteria bacterium]|nr:hypothetical protein [Acidobacteriota bacterium]